MLDKLNRLFQEAVIDVKNLWDDERAAIYGLAMAAASVAADASISFIPLFAGAGVSIVCNRLAELQSGKATREDFANCIANDFSNPQVQRDFIQLLQVMSGVRKVSLSNPDEVEEFHRALQEYVAPANRDVEDRKRIVADTLMNDISSLNILNQETLFELSCFELSNNDILNDLIEYNKLPRKPGSAKLIRKFTQQRQLVEQLKSL